jgi:succinyl-CoA synthetase beta subunit
VISLEEYFPFSKVIYLCFVDADILKFVDFLLKTYNAQLHIDHLADLDFSFLEMNPFTLVNGEPYPLDMRGELDDTAAFKNFKTYDTGFLFTIQIPIASIPIIVVFVFI